jgi:hypothetical protein
LLALLSALGASPAMAAHAALPKELIALDSPEGQRLLVEATAREDFFRLTSTYITQEKPSYCGVASGVMVLNALPINAPDAEPAPLFTQANFWNDAATRVHPAESVGRGGMTLDQLGDLLRCHPTDVRVVHASDSTLEGFRALASTNMAETGNYVIVNYQRAEVGQESMGHISPLAAYHEKSDRFLLFDVARYKYPPVWVETPALFRAMKTDDIASGLTRGFVVVAAAPSAPGPGPAKPARSPLVMILVALGASFFVGAGAGAGLATWRARRNYKAAG